MATSHRVSWHSITCAFDPRHARALPIPVTVSPALTSSPHPTIRRLVHASHRVRPVIDGSNGCKTAVVGTEGGLASGSDELRACEESVGELGPERGASGEVKESDGPQGAVHKMFLLKFDDCLDDGDGDGDCDGGGIELRGEGRDYDGAVSRRAREQPAERSPADGLVCMPRRRGVCIQAKHLFCSVVLAECWLVVLTVFAGRCLTSSSRGCWLDAGAHSCGERHSPIPVTRCLVAAQRMQTCRRQNVVMPYPHLLSDYTLRTRRVCPTTEGAGATTNVQATDGGVFKL